MLNRKWLIFGSIVVGILGIGLLLWPIIEQQLMEIPFAHAITAISAGHVAEAQETFTPSAVAEYQDIHLPMRDVLRTLAPDLNHEQLESTVRFAGIQQITARTADTADVNFTIIIYVGDEMGRRLPVRRRGRARLARTGWFTWRIHRITTDDPTFGAALQEIDHHRAPE